MNDDGLLQGVVTAAVSLIETLARKNPDDYKGCVSLAVSRLSRVSSSLLHLRRAMIRLNVKFVLIGLVTTGC